jgi:hypothetical protein
MKKQETIECKCGCGKTLLKYDNKGRPRMYLRGHNFRKIHPVKKPCECGCGGYPKLGKDYINGHQNRDRVYGPHSDEHNRKIGAGNTKYDGCSVYGCDANHFSNSFCQKHYGQMRVHGKIFDRTCCDPNEIIVKGDIAFIRLYDKDQRINGTAIIDKEDAERCSTIRWFKTVNGYVYSGTGKRFLHNFILDRIPSRVIITDHINRNPMDCRKSNLRLCNHTENRANSGARADNTSGFKGVGKYDGQKWRALVQCNGKPYQIGMFDTKEEAATAYDMKAKELFGEFAYLNFPEKEITHDLRCQCHQEN